MIAIWTPFNGNPRYTSSNRFGCSSRSVGVDRDVFMIEVDSLKDSTDLQEILGYINTVSNKQKKGIGGYVK